MKKIFFSLLIIVIVFISCGKYKEGPAFSLRTKNARIINKWKLESADTLMLTKANPIETDTTGGTIYAKYIEFKENGLYYNPPNYGTWSFDDEKKNVNIKINKTSFKYEILKLRNNELWLFYTDSVISIERHFISFE